MREGEPLYKIITERNPTPDDGRFWQIVPHWLRARVWFLQAVISGGWEPMTLERAEEIAERERQNLPPERRVRLEQAGSLPNWLESPSNSQ